MSDVSANSVSGKLAAHQSEGRMFVFSVLRCSLHLKTVTGLQHGARVAPEPFVTDAR